jgi:hypothetical protein
MFNLNYTLTTLGVQVEDKLHLGIRKQKMVNTNILAKIKCQKKKTATSSQT